MQTPRRKALTTNLMQDAPAVRPHFQSIFFGKNIDLNK